MTATQIHHLAVGDNGPSLSRQAAIGGEPLPLAGTAPTFTMWNSRDMEAPVTGYNATAAVMVTAAEGRVRFDFPTPTTLPAGMYLARFHAVDTAGDRVSIPNEGHIMVLVSA